MSPFFSKLCGWLGLRAQNADKEKRQRRRPVLEHLEHRNLLAGDAALGSLTGAAFFDFNSNGIRDAGETAAPGVVVTLTGGTLTGTNVNVSTVSAADGSYIFSKIGAGVYQLTATNPAVYEAGTGTAGNFGGTGVPSAINNIFIDAGQAMTGYNLPVAGVAVGAISLRMCLNLFDPSVSLPVGGSGTGAINADGTTPAAPSAGGNLTLGGSVFADADSDNTVDAGEGIANVRLALTGVETASGAPILAFANSTANGSYSFAGLNAGSYNINILQSPQGFRSGTPLVGTLGGVVRRNDQIVDITLAAGQNGTGYLFNQIAGVAPPTNTAVPTIVAQLATDSAFTPGTVTDGITRDPSVYGFVSNVGLLATFEAALDSAAFQDFTSIVGADGRFYINLSQLAALRGSNLTDGSYVLHLRARDALGQITSAVDVAFTVDQTAPVTPTGTALDPADDPNNDARTNSAAVKIIGQAAENTTVLLIANNTVVATVNTGGSSQFAFENVSLAANNNAFTLRSIDLAGNSSADATVVFFRNVDPTSDGTANATFSDNQNAANRTIELNTFFDDENLTDSIVTLRTNQGNISIELFDRAAPGTVANFLDYVETNRYDGTLFHRLQKSFVLQGGGVLYDDAEADKQSPVPSSSIDPTIKGEPDATNRPNARYTIAMAQTSGADTATNQFFFNLVDNTNTLSVQQSFTVFGKLATTADQTLVDKLAADANGPALSGGLGVTPLLNYNGTFPTGVTRDNFIVVNDVTIDKQDEEFSFEVVSNDRTDLVDASITDNNRLTLNYLNVGTGTATIVVRATDKGGLSVTRSFTINVT